MAENCRGEKTRVSPEKWLLSPLRLGVLFTKSLLFSSPSKLKHGRKEDQYRLVTRVIEYQRMNKASLIEVMLSYSLSPRLLVTGNTKQTDLVTTSNPLSLIVDLVI